MHFSGKIACTWASKARRIVSQRCPLHPLTTNQVIGKVRFPKIRRIISVMQQRQNSTNLGFLLITRRTLVSLT